MTQETISYRYSHWGPCLYSTQITQERVQQLLGLCHEAQKDTSAKLAPNLASHQELKLPPDKVFNILKPYFISYSSVYSEYHSRNLPFLNLTAAWVNFMKAGDFNPPHNHGGEISFVVFPDVPDELIEENKAFKGNSVGPGAIDFRYVTVSPATNQFTNSHGFMPRTGSFYIFPARLEHWVFPFKSDVTRISISGNLAEKGEDHFMLRGLV